MKKRAIPTTDEELEARKEEFFAAFDAESDRGCVLVGGAILDELLEMLLRRQMLAEESVLKCSVKPLFSTLGPLGSFWAKVQLTNALGLLEETTYKDLGIIREIRNYFAHHYGTADFNDPQIVHLCEKLKTADAAVNAMSKHRPEIDKSIEPRSPPHPRRRSSDRMKKERMRFTLSVSFMAGSFQAYSQPSLQVTRTTRPFAI